MFHREAGVFKTTYASDMALYPLPIAKWTVAVLALLFVVVAPLTLHEYYLSILNLIFIAVVGALGLNILVGYTGQISLGHGAFMSVGAYTAANLAVRLDLPFWLTLPAGGLMAAFIGVLVGVPSLRIKGLYLAIATLAGQLIIEWTINHVPAISGGTQASIQVARPSLFGYSLSSQTHLYFFLLFFSAQVPTVWMSMAIMATTIGLSCPKATASRMNGLNLSLFSMNCGANAEPSVSFPTSLARSMITRWPCLSKKPASPVFSQPSPVRVSRVISSCLK